MSDIADQFHKLYYDSKVWTNTRWMGVQCYKNPLDLWIYQEMLWEKRPDLVIECGTAYGGSALFLAHLMDTLDHGTVLTIDQTVLQRPWHKRIRYLEGRSSVDDGVVAVVAETANRSNNTLVILDSDHSKNHVLSEMLIYRSFVTRESYLIVEDTNINGHPVYPGYGEGPWEAVAEFLSQDSSFTVDSSREKFFMTFNPKGFLKRVK
jgi:cephalosporin hydroxylase